MKLFGQDQLAQLGGLQAVDGTVVVDFDSLLALQQILALHSGGAGLRGGRLALAWTRASSPSLFAGFSAEEEVSVACMVLS